MIRTLKGTDDILPEDIGRWQYVESQATEVFRLYGYREIRTPLIEESALFTRSIGEATEIVQKQMYAFEDRGGRKICLRPEETASVTRAYLQHSLDKKGGLARLYYIGPMFRSERPQAGRKRQFHQMGIEAIGSYNPFLDVECIVLFRQLLDTLGIDGYSIALNSIGCPQDKRAYSEAVKAALIGEVSALCGDCRERLEKNPLRILDCKNNECGKIVQEKVKDVGEYLCDGCKEHFASVEEALKTLKIPYRVDPALVRGLDYYTKTTFEINHPGLGAKDAIGGGGRYDELVAQFGGKRTGAVGFAIGMERLIALLAEDSGSRKALAGVYIVTLGSSALSRAVEFATFLRDSGIAVQLDYEGRSIKAQMREADKQGAGWVIVIGEEEIREDVYTLKDMKSGEQKKVEKNKILGVLIGAGN